MRFLSGVFSKNKKVKPKTKEDFQQEILIKLGREQFKKLLNRGLQLPIAVL